MAASGGRTITLSVSDNGKSLCVKRGMGVLVMLKGTITSEWAPVHASSTALVPRANGHLMLARGVTGASFVAARPGVSVISSSRAVCPPARTPPADSATASPPGSVSCDARLSYRVTVVVVK